MRKIKIIEPLTQAVAMTETLLFKPFNLTFYFKLAFVAWLAYIGTTGMNGFNNSFQPGGGMKKISREQNAASANYGNRTPGAAAEVKTHADARHDAVSAGPAGLMRGIIKNANPFEMVPQKYMLPVIIAFAVISIPLLIFFLYLQSRGKMMFFKSLAYDRLDVPVRHRWNETSACGMSFFIFRLKFFVAATVFMLAASAVVFFAAMALHKSLAASFLPLFLCGMALLFLAIAPVMIPYTAFEIFAPVLMLKTGISALEAFKRIFRFTWENFWELLLFAIAGCLVSLVMTLLFGILLVIIGLLTCCIGCVFFAIMLILPFCWMLICLPLYVFGAYWMMLYIKQFGDDFNLFAEHADGRQDEYSEKPPAHNGTAADAGECDARNDEIP